MLTFKFAEPVTKTNQKSLKQVIKILIVIYVRALIENSHKPTYALMSQRTIILLSVIRKFNTVIDLNVNSDPTVSDWAVLPITDLGAVTKLAVNVK